VANVRKVYDELTGRKDDLSDWVGARRFFLDEDDRVVPSFAAASAWASGNSYRPSATTNANRRLPQNGTAGGARQPRAYQASASGKAALSGF